MRDKSCGHVTLDTQVYSKLFGHVGSTCGEYVGQSGSVRDKCVTCARYSARCSSWPSFPVEDQQTKSGVRYYAVDTVLYGA